MAEEDERKLAVLERKLNDLIMKSKNFWQNRKPYKHHLNEGKLAGWDTYRDRVT